MDKFLHSHLFRCLVCLVLVCCILVNCSPIRAKASGVIAGLTLIQLFGLATIIIGTTCGAIYLVDNMDTISAIGDSTAESLQKTMDDLLETDEEWEDFKNYADGFYRNLFSGGDDPYDLDKSFQQKLAKGLLAAIAGSIVSAIAAGSMEAEVEEEVEVDVPEGFAGYDGYTLKQLPDLTNFSGEPYICLLWTGSYELHVSDKPFMYAYQYGSSGIWFTEDCYWEHYKTETANGDWVFQSSGERGAGGGYTGTVLWTNKDICNSDGSLYKAGTSVINSGDTTTEKKTITIDPIYVGDLPTQIENGDLDEDESKEKILAPLPDYIDITKVIKSPETAVEDLTQWQQQVVDNQKTLEEALEDITGELEDIKDNTDPSDPSTPSDPPMVTPPPLVSGYVPHPLDMRNFFPFCIPFDLYDFFTVLAAEPEAPKFHWEIQDLSGHAYAIDIDLKSWDPVAELFRKFQLLLFITGLAAATRKFIKW